jgi:hypothetical protein
MVLKFITKEGATLKFPIVVNAVAMDYLKGLDTHVLLNLIEKIKEADNGNVVELIWGNISDAVETKMFDEFSSLYPSGKNSADFKDLISAGVYVELTPPNRGALESLMSTKGATASPSQGGFFAFNDTETDAVEGNITSAMR